MTAETSGVCNRMNHVYFLIQRKLNKKRCSTVVSIPKISMNHVQHQMPLVELLIISNVDQLKDMDSLTVSVAMKEPVWWFVIALELLLLTSYAPRDILVWNMRLCGRERMERMERTGYTPNVRKRMCKIFKGI
jgi:hypothetical protein